ncbi:MAG: SDR family oxidoreductase [Proteobacteria bacterium]|nr:SDR family oxidoreductase [Pseudomonadota bacterium]
MSTPQRVVITAGGAGIGRALALAFHASGARVAVCDIDAGAISELAEIEPEILGRVANVTSAEDMAAFLADVDAAFGGVDVALANAGTGGPAGPIENLDLKDWRACISANLDGAFMLCQWAAKHMKAQKTGSIILTSSTAGMFGYPMRSPYATAKWGVIGLMKTLACELGPYGVRVNAICPGAVEGDRMERVLQNEAVAKNQDIEDVRQIYVKGVSMRTWVNADDIADAALFLASTAASKISGLVMPVDGHTESLT